MFPDSASLPPGYFTFRWDNPCLFSDGFDFAGEWIPAFAGMTTNSAGGDPFISAIDVLNRVADYSDT